MIKPLLEFVAVGRYVLLTYIDLTVQKFCRNQIKLQTFLSVSERNCIVRFWLNRFACASLLLFGINFFVQWYQ